VKTSERLAKLKKRLAALEDELHVYLQPWGAQPSAPSAVVMAIIRGPRAGTYTRAQAEAMSLWPPPEKADTKKPTSAPATVEDSGLPPTAYRTPRRPRSGGSRP